jgi:lauroyl/myristoyl acyltransferase
MIRRLLLSVFILYLAFVHLPFLRLVGPRCAIILARLAAWLHWLLTFVGAERHALRAMREVLPATGPGRKPRAVLRQYLALKHRLYVEYDACGTARGRRYLEQSYLPYLEGREHLDAALREGRGAILLVFHYGTVLPMYPALRMLGYEVMLHRATAPVLAWALPGARSAFGWAMRVAVRASAAAEQSNGPTLYHNPNFIFPLMLRRLRQKGIVSINADGMAGTDFNEVPFLGGTLRLPTGPARMSAHSGAPLLPLFALPDGLSRHHFVIHPPLRCPHDSPDAVRETMTAYAAVLDQYVRQRPEAWLTWRRLLVQRHPDGRLRLDVGRPASPQENFNYFKQFRPPAEAAPGATLETGGAH